MKNFNAIKTIADYYRYEKQKMKLVEEVGELLQALNKFDEAPAESVGYLKAKDHLFEEIADVSIMLDQIVYLLCGEGRTEEKRIDKLERQLGRIDEEEKNNRPIPVIYGTHDIRYRGGSKVYTWRVPEGMDMPSVGDVVVVNTAKGVDNMIVARTGFMPYSEAKHHKTAIRKAVLEDGQDL